MEFRFETKQVALLQDFVHLHIVVRPHIFSSYNGTRVIVESSPYSLIQYYFCHKHDAHERF